MCTATLVVLTPLGCGCFISLGPVVTAFGMLEGRRLLSCREVGGFSREKILLFWYWKGCTFFFFFFGRCIVLPNILQNLAGNIALVLMFLSELQISLCTDAVYKRGAARLPANCSCVGVSFGSACAGSSSPGCWDPSAGARGHRQDAGG